MAGLAEPSGTELPAQVAGATTSPDKPLEDVLQPADDIDPSNQDAPAEPEDAVMKDDDAPAESEQVPESVAPQAPMAPMAGSVDQGQQEDEPMDGEAEGEGENDTDQGADNVDSSGSEYEPPTDEKPKVRKGKGRAAAAGASAKKATPQRAPKTPLNKVRTGRVEKSSAVRAAPVTPANPDATPEAIANPPSNQGSPVATTLRCPVKGCGQTFTGRNPRQSLWHHLKYYATRGVSEKADFEKAHGDAHKQMKKDAEPKGTPVERNRISSSDYRKKNPEKAKTSARLSNFRARARKKGLTGEKDIEEQVAKWEKEWQEKQAKEASEYFSGILLSAFE